MTVFTYEALPKLAAALYDHGDSITNVAAHQMEIDIRLAARACSNFASLRFRIAEIAEAALTQDPAATRRDLPAALAAQSPDKETQGRLTTGPFSCPDIGHLLDTVQIPHLMHCLY